ncbi:unnamed protein product, partial [Prorocentrum cordatum]
FASSCGSNFGTALRVRSIEELEQSLNKYVEKYTKTEESSAQQSSHIGAVLRQIEAQEVVYKAAVQELHLGVVATAPTEGKDKGGGGTATAHFESHDYEYLHKYMYIVERLKDLGQLTFMTCDLWVGEGFTPRNMKLIQIIGQEVQTDVPTEKLMGLTLEPPGYDDLTAPVGAFLEQIGGTGDKFTLMGTTKQQAVEIMNQAHEACDRRAWTELCAATGCEDGWHPKHYHLLSDASLNLLAKFFHLMDLASSAPDLVQRTPVLFNGVDRERFGK